MLRAGSLCWFLLLELYQQKILFGLDFQGDGKLASCDLRESLPMPEFRGDVYF